MRVQLKIDHESAQFPFLQLADQLRAGIRHGEWLRGEKLPSIVDIVEQTGLDPMTIRRGMRVLADEGLVEIVRGRGTFVRKG